ncbi:PAS domain S-box protein [Agriterribacter sp.]|uniref:PAS domain S-box protein n=1 Tax=Agriterribacter sp. TaxID=2821509 RepID=UPI002C082B2E|nr:PAS domain S-box protein [Agriterribacter sp.]HTN06677.1 PAS domain S-box protein [Agriterribacter sp.]
MKLTTGKILLLTLFISTVIVAVTVYISIRQSSKVNHTFTGISNAQNILYYTEKLLAGATMNDIMVREYILAGDDRYLSSLQQIYDDFKHNYDQLKHYAKADPLQRQKIDSLPLYIFGGKAWSDSIINIRRLEGQAKAMEMTTTDTINNFVSAARGLISRITLVERLRLKTLQQENAKAVADLRTVWYIEIALLIVLMIMLVQKLRVDVLWGRKANAAMQYNALLMEHIQDAVISTDKNFTIVSWNRKAERLSGWNEDEIRGRKVVEIVKPVYKEAFQSVIVKTLLKNESWEGETTFQKKSGEQATVLVSAAVIKAANGKMKGVVAIVRDISAQQQLEEQLKKFNSELGKQVEDRTLEVKKVVDQLLASEKKYKFLFEHNPLPMWMMTMPGMHITDVNDAAIHHYGYARHAFLKLNFRDIHPQADADAFIRYMQENASGYHNAGVWRQYKRDRSIIFVEIYAYSMRLDGRDIRLILSNDITQKVAVEKKLKQSLGQVRMLSGHLEQVREDERKNIAREIHDELGQQLTILKMDVAWTIKKMQHPDEMVVTRLSGLLETIDATMKWVRRICAELRPALLDDLGLIAAMEWQAGEFEKNTGVVMEVMLPAGIPELPPETKTGLFRIFQESLTNIARHAEARHVKVNLREKEGALILNIEDNGKGFDMAILNQKRTLGILGMEERSLMMGGKYVIASEPGGGTTVKVIVPVEKKNTII